MKSVMISASALVLATSAMASAQYHSDVYYSHGDPNPRPAQVDDAQAAQIRALMRQQMEQVSRQAAIRQAAMDPTVQRQAARIQAAQAERRLTEEGQRAVESTFSTDNADAIGGMYSNFRRKAASSVSGGFDTNASKSAFETAKEASRRGINQARIEGAANEEYQKRGLKLQINSDYDASRADDHAHRNGAVDMNVHDVAPSERSDLAGAISQRLSTDYSKDKYGCQYEDPHDGMQTNSYYQNGKLVTPKYPQTVKQTANGSHIHCQPTKQSVLQDISK